MSTNSGVIQESTYNRCRHNNVHIWKEKDGERRKEGGGREGQQMFIFRCMLWDHKDGSVVIT